MRESRQAWGVWPPLQMAVMVLCIISAMYVPPALTAVDGTPLAPLAVEGFIRLIAAGTSPTSGTASGSGGGVGGGVSPLGAAASSGGALAQV